MLHKLINPASIAIIGASEDTSKPGGKLLQNIIISEYAGHVYPVNPKYSVVQSIPTYASVTDLPTTPDLALIVIPAKYVQAALVELAEKGAKVVVVLSAGFGEVSPAGKQEEQQLARIADEHNMLLLGPNCSGLLTYAHASKFTGFVPKMKPKGVDILSASGAMIDFLAEQAVRRGIPLRSFMTVGNAAQSNITELLTLFDEQDDLTIAPIKLIYAESINDPQSFLQHARNLRRKGGVLAGIKAGTSTVGRRAAASHTGAMATNDTAVEALFGKAGLIRVQSRLELIDMACALVCTKGKNEGRRVCVISDAGGPAVMLADELAHWNLTVPPLKASTQQKLRDLLPAGATVENPIDCLPTRTSAMMRQMIDIIATAEADNIDYLLLIIGDPGLIDIWEMYDVVIRAMDKYSLPILPTFCSVLTTSTSLHKYRQTGKCYFEDEVAMARALGRIVNQPPITNPITTVPEFNHQQIAEILTGAAGVLSPPKTRELLLAAGLHFPRQQALTDVDQLAAVDIPFPWAMKAMGPVHKSDVGGVVLGVENLAQAGRVWQQLLQIEGTYGCLIQEMVTGTEVIIGSVQEGEFGQLVMFGLGGIYTEAFRDVNFCLAPLSLAEAKRMIDASQGLPLIKGARGQPGMDINMLCDWVIRIGLLVHHFSQIQELDLNPVKGYGRELRVVDARIIVAPAG
jgi:acetyltransferase